MEYRCAELPTTLIKTPSGITHKVVGYLIRKSAINISTRPMQLHYTLLIILGIFGALYWQSHQFKHLNSTSAAIILGGFLLLGCQFYSYMADEFQLKCIISDKDGQRYCVRERAKVRKAANLLAAVTARCNEMVRFMEAKYPDDPRVRRLVEGFNPSRISETLPTSELTAYSENKGEKIAFCLNRRKDNDNKLIDLNTLTFVALHELSHIMTSSVGHKQDFWENFKFLLQNAKEAGVYNPVDYKRDPQDYCGMTITDNPYFDLK